jgi:hypothetical protein
MARPVTITTSGTSTSSVCGLCWYTEIFSVSVIATVTGTATYTLQFTGDNIQASNFSAASANWQDHPMMTGATTSGIVEFTAPVTAVRLNQTAGAGSVSAKVIQAGL